MDIMENISTKTHLGFDEHFGREHDIVESSEMFRKNIAFLMKALFQRVKENLDPVVDQESVQDFFSYAANEDFFSPDQAFNKEKVANWISKFCDFIESMKEASDPYEKESSENLATLSQSLSNMEQFIPIVFDYLQSEDSDNKSNETMFLKDRMTKALQNANRTIIGRFKFVKKQAA